MVKKIFFWLIWLTPLSTVAQSNVPGRFSLSTGFDWGVHYVTSEFKSDGTTIDQDTTGATTSQFQFNAHYSIAKWFSAGLGFKTGKYHEYTDPGVVQRNTVNQFYLDTRFYMLNKEKFNLYAGLAIGSASLHIDHWEEIFEIPVQYIADFKSPHSRFHLGGNWYIGKKVGFWFQTEFNKHLFNMNSFKLYINEVEQPGNYTGKFDTRGLQIALGVCIKFKE